MSEENNSCGKESLNLDEIASRLGLSKSTVSRAISGKGRISEETRRRVREYIDISGYRPNAAARSLAQSRSFSIGVIFPSDKELSEIPFFQTCLMGICEAAQANDYDVVVTVINGADISGLDRIVKNNKVDGIILTRAVVNDPACEYLKKVQFPFVVIGSSDDENVIQIDTDHASGCEELTGYLIKSGCRKISLLIGSRQHIVNQSRRMGYEKAMRDNGVYRADNVYEEMNCRSAIERAVGEIIKGGSDCILCGDDYICSRAMTALEESEINVPSDIKIASFYNSAFLRCHNPPVTALDINVKELGIAAAQTIINILNGKTCDERRLLDYEISIKKSTM